jgi:hypothetical protein
MQNYEKVIILISVENDNWIVIQTYDSNFWYLQNLILLLQNTVITYL